MSRSHASVASFSTDIRVKERMLSCSVAKIVKVFEVKKMNC